MAALVLMASIISSASPFIAKANTNEPTTTDATDRDSFAQQIPVRGVVRSAHQSSISPDITARVETITFREGEQFFGGDLLLKLDCRQQIAEWEAAEAIKREMELALKSALYLTANHAGSEHKVETAKARLDRAKADLKAITNRVDQCEVRAPYDGLISGLSVQEHEMAIAGKPVISIISFGDPRLELIVPSVWLTWLQRDMVFDFSIDETQTSHKGVVTRVGAVIDSVSQTVKVYAKFSNSPMDILPGMSGTATFK